MSGGDLQQLREAVRLGHVDWRDLIGAARFDQPPYFRRWQPRYFDARTAAQWSTGSPLAGVEFRLNDQVEVVDGMHLPKEGTIVGLTGLEPEPRYLLELTTGQPAKVWQGRLRRLDNEGVSDDSSR